VRLEPIVAFVLLIALSIYLVTGCADFGAGFWELVVRGKGREREQEAISKALAPIWEANHVWLVVLIVLLSGGFPKALAVICTSLQTPLLLMLIGISLRGGAFVFRHYGPTGKRFQNVWGLVFSASSTVAPFFLGATLGAAVSGSIHVPPDGVVKTDFLTDWLSPFPISVGLYTLTISVFLSAVYLSAETSDPFVREAFRKHAIAASVGLGAVAFGVLILSRTEAPLVFERLTAHAWSWPFHLVTACLSIAALLLLIKRKVHWARTVAILQVLAIMVGLGLAQYPYIVAPDVTIYNSAAPTSSLTALLEVTAGGLILVAPGFAYLYWVFKFKQQPTVSTEG
jgi:cytochrome d ubiquinol oxidase subunit II